MKYDIDKIKRLYDSGKEFKFLFFWGHKPSKVVGSFCFSQWYPSPFEFDNKTYLTAEHWMMASKARLFMDFEIEKQILSSSKPAQVKELGRKIKGFDENVWVENRFDLVVKGNIHKFTRNEEMKKFLLSTNDQVIVEASPYDTIWGIGLSRDSKNIENPHTWKGLNLLGFALMEVRERMLFWEKSENLNSKNTVPLYRPVGPKEFALIKESAFSKFPPRLPQQPIFYPVIDEFYAKQIAKDWNVEASGSGFVTKFEVDKNYILQFELKNVGNSNHNELWIPAEQLEEFNNHIEGKIEVIAEFA